MAHRPNGMGKRQMVRAEENDAYTRWRRWLCCLQRAGAVKSIKRRTHRRERRQGRQEARNLLRTREDD